MDPANLDRRIRLPFTVKSWDRVMVSDLNGRHSLRRVTVLVHLSMKRRLLRPPPPPPPLHPHPPLNLQPQWMVIHNAEHDIINPCFYFVHRASLTTCMAAVSHLLMASSVPQTWCWLAKWLWLLAMVMWARAVLRLSGPLVLVSSSQKSIPSTLFRPPWKVEIGLSFFYF